MALDWEDFRFVLALARAGTLSTAARHLSVSHTTVKRRVASLEETLGTRLFEHLPSGYQLTSAGEEVLQVAQHIEERVLSLDRSVLGRDAQLSGTLRVTTVDMVAVIHAADVGAFAKRYPGIELELCASYQTASLTRREADVAIRLTNAPPEHLVGRRVGRMEYAAFAAASLLEESGVTVTAGSFLDRDELGALPWLGWDERLRARLSEAWMQQHVPNAQVVARLDMAMVMCEAVSRGVGATLLPVSIARHFATLRQLTPIYPELGVDIWLLTHQDLRATARIRAFTDYMAGVLLEAHPPHRPDVPQA